MHRAKEDDLGTEDDLAKGDLATEGDDLPAAAREDDLAKGAQEKDLAQEGNLAKEDDLAKEDSEPQCITSGCSGKCAFGRPCGQWASLCTFNACVCLDAECPCDDACGAGGTGGNVLKACIMNDAVGAAFADTMDPLMEA